MGTTINLGTVGCAGFLLGLWHRWGVPTPPVGSSGTAEQGGNSTRPRALVADFGKSERVIEQKLRSLVLGDVHHG